MGENSSSENVVEKKSKIKTLKGEFNKVMWPDKETVSKKTIAVVIVTAVLALLISMIDYMVKFGLDKILSI